MEEPKPKLKKHYVITIKYDDPFPKTFESRPIEARAHGRAIDFGYRAFKKTRPKKREPEIVHVTSRRI